MIRKIISFICLLSIFIESVPVNALSYGISDIISQETTESNSNNDTVDKKSDSDKTANSNDNNEKSDSKDNDKEVISNLEDNIFNAYINGENELAFSIGFDKKERKFVVKKQSEKQLAKDKLDTIIYKISVYDKENKEKLNIELLGSDTGNTEKLNILNETKYEIGDTIKITPLDPKNGLKILGDIQGDIDNKKEDYSDGVDNLDYIDNVRFEITENNLKTVYNEAPVFEGLTDLLNVEDPNVDVFQGVKVKDDHDGEIDNSKIVVSVQEKTETSAILTYTVQDSWGRNASGTRKISAADSSNTDKSQNNPTTYSGNQSSQSLTDNIITVEGIPYSGNVTERFKIKFDPVSKEIQLYDDDGRFMNNKSEDEYFKFELYDKDMNLKTSATLLGTDKSDSEKLNAINNFLFEEGDYIGIWHAESDSKLKIGGTVKQTTKNQEGEATPNGTTVNYQGGLPQKAISERRFRIKNTGLEEVINEAPVINALEKVTMARGENKDLLDGVDKKVTDDFDKFNADTLENGDVSITHSKFDNTRVGEQTITYTATDKWGKSGTQTRTIEVTSENPLDTTYIEFMGKYNTDNEGNTKNNETTTTTNSLFKIRIDSVLKQLYVENLDSIPDKPIDPNKTSSIFKLKVYTQGGVLQKTLNIKGTDKLRTVLKRINGYKYNETDRIELWSTTPKNIKVDGKIVEGNSGSTNGYQDYRPNEDVTNNVANVDYKEDYTNGIDNDDYMKNVRFEIGSTYLKYIYNQAPKFNINTELTAERNGKVDLMNGITASDDHDSNLTEKITHGNLDTSTVGEKYVEYKVVDSWGRATLIRRKVTVYPYNSLEYNYITVKNSETNDPILSIKFDEKNKKFNVNKLDVSKIPSSLNGTDELLKLELIKTNSSTKTNNNQNIITVTKDSLTNNNGSDIVNKINNLSYNHGDYISLKVYDSLNGILISGKSHIVLNGFTSEDEMSNSRFKIKPEGLQIEYNEAPVFSGLDNKLYLYKGNDLDENYARNGITVIDDIDNNIESSSINITNLEEINNHINEIGEYTLEYQVTDSWGRSTSGSRILAVISKSVSNDIEFYDTNGTNKLFSIKFNPVKNSFDVTRDTTGIPNSEPLKRNSEETTPQNGGSNTPSEGEDSSQTEVPKVFKLGVYNAQGKEIGKLELTEEGINDPNAFNELENITVSDNYYFSVWSNTPSRIKIKGHMTGNNALGEDENKNEDYSNGISNNDYMDNVRFMLKTDGLEAIYNKAPQINLPDEELTEFAGDPIDYLKGVTVLDDHDIVIPTDNVKVDKVENRTENTLIIGSNTVKLSVKDSWGREARVNRNIIIKNGILKNEISIYNESNFNEQNKVLGIKFDPIESKLILDKRDNQFINSGNSPRYVKIKIERYNSDNSILETIVPEVSFNANDRPIGNHLSQFESYRFKYGDKISIYHGHPNRFGIYGKVTDSRENYTDGVQNPENLLYTKFEITPSGLKAVYTDPDESNITDNKNIIGPMAPEKFPFKIEVLPSERIFKVLTKERNMILAGDNSIVYKIVHIGSDGRVKLSSEFRGNHWADIGSASEEIDKWNRRSFEYNDALYIWHKYPSRSIIKGNINEQREDYSNGVDDPDNMNHVVFKLTANGLESVYNKAPIINGVEDKDIYIGQSFNPSNGVTYEDDHDQNNLSTSISSSNDPDNGNIDINTLGENIVTYTATDRWNKTTTVERKVTVRPNLYKNIFKIYPDTNSGTVPNGQTYSNTDARKPAFEIGFDSVANKYRVFNQSKDRLSITNPENTAFGIEIKGSNGNVKKEITLTGNDRGNSDKLNELNEVTYSNGDIVRIYRSNLDAISFEGDITGDIPSSEDMNNETNKFDYMKNTGFKVSNEGLEAVYNHAPILNVTNGNRTISKGTTLNLIEGINVSDKLDKNNISPANVTVRINGETIENKTNYTFNKLGIYNVEYILTDSWGRSVLQESTITVESKVKENSIEVYGPNNTLAFKVMFNTTENKFKLEGSGDTSTSTYTSSSDQKGYFEMIVRNIKGKEKYSVTLNGNSQHDREQLAKIHEKEFTIYDTIALHGHDHNTVKIKGNVINSNNNRTNNDYSNGFGTTDKYSEVRFKITDDGFKEMTKKNPTISELDPKIIKRGDEIDFLEGVVVDVKDTNNEDYEIEVNKNSFNKLKEGTYNVTYTVTNSWGSNVQKERQITVEPRNELERVKLKLTNTSNQNIFTIGFDSIQRKLRVLSNVEGGTIDSSSNELEFVITAYDLTGNTLGTIELKGNQTIDKDILDRINNFNYIEGYRLNVWAKDPSRISTEGPITNGTVNNINSFTNKDKMENGRFEILEDGLEYIYNFAPTITGGEKAIEYYKGTILSVPEDIKVNDDLDNISKNEVVIDDDQVDYDELGEFPITYVVEDTWGRVAKKAGKINIKSAMDSNSIDVYPVNTTTSDTATKSSDKAFSIKFVREENENKIKIEDATDTQLNPSNPSGKFMDIVIYGSNGEKKKTVSLNGSDTGNSLKSNGQSESVGRSRTNTESGLNDYVYTTGDYIALEGITDTTKSAIKIQGTVVNEREQYTDGINDLDNIHNVRFKFTDLGLESVYNEKPKIKIKYDVKIDGIKGDDIPYMRGVTLSDDHDKLTKYNVKVTWNPNTNENQESTENTGTSRTIGGEPVVGNNILQYIVTDSWGRSSDPIIRDVNLSNGILQNTINFKGYNIEDVIKISFSEIDNNKVLMNVDTRNDTMWNSDEIGFYKIKVYKPNQDTPFYNISLNGMDYADTTNKLDPIKNEVIEYGTKFEFYAGYPDRISIKGSVRDQREDYSDGAQNPENYSSVKFEVTNSGLKSIYTEEDNFSENENIISLVAKESLPLKFKVDPVQKTITRYSCNSTGLQWELGNDVKVFEMVLIGANGIEKDRIEGKSRDRGNSSKFNKTLNFDIGDKLTIWHKTPRRIVIKGSVQGAKEDYSNGVDNSRNLTEAVFELTATGFKAVYKSAPRLSGAKDYRLEKMELNNSQKTALVDYLKSDLRAIDDIQGDITSSIQVDDTRLNTNQIGLYEVEYRVTNSNGRTTRRSSTVIVYAKPIIEEDSITLELDGSESNDEAIKDYIKSKLTVTDEEDDRDRKEVKVEVLNHDVNITQEGLYKANIKATDSDGDTTEKEISVNIARTINVSVPTTIPFQVVTNLNNKEADPFISGILKLQNNNTSDVNVSVESFGRANDSGVPEPGVTKNNKSNSEQLELVDPNSVDNWDDLYSDETMTKMALGMYVKSGINGRKLYTKGRPLWLLSNGMSNKTPIGILPRAESLKNPTTAKLSFTSKHGKNFKGGTSRGKFSLVFKFE